MTTIGAAPAPAPVVVVVVLVTGVVVAAALAPDVDGKSVGIDPFGSNALPVSTRATCSASVVMLGDSSDGVDSGAGG